MKSTIILHKYEYCFDVNDCDVVDFIHPTGTIVLNFELRSFHQNLFKIHYFPIFYCNTLFHQPPDFCLCPMRITTNHAITLDNSMTGVLLCWVRIFIHCITHRSVGFTVKGMGNFSIAAHSAPGYLAEQCIAALLKAHPATLWQSVSVLRHYLKQIF